MKPKKIKIKDIKDYHIRRWYNGLETGHSMEEIREDMKIAIKSIKLGKSLDKLEKKLIKKFVKQNTTIPNNMCDDHQDNYGYIQENGICDICDRKYETYLTYES